MRTSSLAVAARRTAGASPSVVRHEIFGSQIVWGGDEPSRTAFCVEGDRLTLDLIEHPVSRRWWILEQDGLLLLAAGA
jgi:hypothetical protein